jgi:hypothetical protein
MGIEGNGKQATPFTFAIGAKGDLRLSGATDKVAWILDDAPIGTESIESGKRLWVPTETVGKYVVIAVWSTQEGPTGLSCWIKIHNPNKPVVDPVNPVDPLKPITNEITDEQITSRVKTALQSEQGKKDSVKFRVAIEELGEKLPQLNKISEMESTLTKALDLVQWPKSGTYPDLSKLTIDLWPANAIDREITYDERKRFIHQCEVISKACEQIGK